MAARKLQQEMDKVFKRVAEGIVVFDGIYDKLQQSTNQAQKEKLEQDLKREIKKLQRLRDQIKSWLSGNEIKDKKALSEHRKMIESEMERFKAVEREMKMKTYSKEGLSAAEKLDPKDKEKNETAQFISSMIEELERQIETLEAEEEQLQSTTKKGRKDAAKIEQLSEIDHHLSRHRWHIEKLETVLRMVENNTLNVDAVNNLKDDIKYYVEENQDADFAEDEELYDELNLERTEDEFEEMLQAQANKGEEPLSTLDDLAVSGDTSASTTITTSTTTAPNTATNNVSTSGRSPSPSVSTASNLKRVGAVPITSASNSAAASPSVSHTNLAKLGANAAAKGPAALSSSIPSASPISAAGPGVANVLSPLPPPPQPSSSSLQKDTSAAAPTPIATGSSSGLTNLSTNKTTAANPVITSTPAPWAQTAAAAVAASSNDEKKTTAATIVNSPSIARSTSSSPHPGGIASPPDLSSSISTSTTNGATAVNNLPPGLQDLVDAFDSARSRISTPPPITSISRMLERSLLHCPDSHIADKPKYYYPESPFPTPSYYPQEPLESLDDPLLLAKVSDETLFYIFYYRQGTYSQYLAAKELKNRSWRFHRQFTTWFQRYEEPKIVSSGQYEQGTYKYFDYEGQWQVRRKANFKFEFVYLENEI